MRARVWYQLKKHIPIIVLEPECEGDRLTLQLLRDCDDLQIRLGKNEQKESLLKDVISER